MLKKHAVLSGIVAALALLLVATRYYPGGSQHDKNSVGFDWRHNYLSNLFNPLAVNGADNTARYWAVGGMLFMSASLGLFFFGFSEKIPQKGAAQVVRYFGVGSMLFAFLSVTPYHDIMVTLANTCVLITLFYISVFLFKSGLVIFKVLSLLCLLALCVSTYIYYSGNFLEFLPVMQKVDLGLAVVWVLGLEYFVGRAGGESQEAQSN